MFINNPTGSDILLLTDVRTEGDANLAYKQNLGNPYNAVLEKWEPGRLVWDTRWEDKVARVALFEFGQVVKAKQRADAKTELLAFLDAHKGQFRTIIVLQSRSKTARKVYNSEYAQASHSGTVCWSVLGPPAPIAEMSGCIWEHPVYGKILPLQNPDNIDYVYKAMINRWLTAVKEDMEVFEPDWNYDTWYDKSTELSMFDNGVTCTSALQLILASAVAGKPITFDLETFSTKDLITVIGLSDGTTTCSVPWESFVPHGQSYTEHGLNMANEGSLVRRIFLSARTLIGHNILGHDIPYLERKGIKTSPMAYLFDTFGAHGSLYSQLRHGLQQCVSYEFLVNPWKTLYKSAGKEFDPTLTEDDPEFWTQSPIDLRRYNVLDTFYNHHLGLKLAEYGGVKL